jgi:hypothetical protein
MKEEGFAAAEAIAELRSKQAFETCFVLDDDRGALDLHELLPFEITEQACDRFPRGPDNLGDFLVG